MFGNVWEFTSSYLKPYPAPPGSLNNVEQEAYDEAWSRESDNVRYMVLRGASYFDILRRSFPAAYRQGAAEHFANFDIGFRYVIPVKDGELVRVQQEKK